MSAKSERAVPFLFVVISALALVVLLLPLVVVVLAGLNAGDFLSFPPQGLSLRWVRAFLTSDTYFGAYLFKLRLGRDGFGNLDCHRNNGSAVPDALELETRRWVARLFSCCRSWLPGLVLGLALYVFYVSTDFGLARSLPGILIGHVLVTCPFVIATVTATLVGFDRSLEEAARSLGAGPLTAFRKITLRIIGPGVMAGAIFAFIISFGQFEIALFLSTPNLQPLPMAMYISLRYAFEPIAAAAGIFAIALVVVSMVVTAWLVDLRRLTGSIRK